MKKSFALAAAAVLFLGIGSGYAKTPAKRSDNSSGGQTFVGRVSPNFDYRNQVQKYIVYDENTKTSYYLIDNGDAAKYCDQKVEINGDLQSGNTTIYVNSIEGLS